MDLHKAGQVSRLDALALRRFAVLDVDRKGSVGPVGEGEHEDGVKGAEAVGVARIEPPGRVREAHVGDPARCRRPPGVHRPVGSVQVGGEVAEQVDRKRLGGQQVGPEALVVEDLVRLDERPAGPGGREGPSGEEARPALPREVEVEAAADESGRRTRPVPVRPDRVPVDLAPHRVVVADCSPELGHLRPARYPVVV